MLQDRRFLIILGFMITLLLINGFLVTKVYQSQELHETLRELMQDHSSRQELQQQLTESFSQAVGQLEEKLLLQDETIQDTLRQLDRLTEENELLKKKLN